MLSKHTGTIAGLLFSNMRLESAAFIDSLQKQLGSYQDNESMLAQNLEQLNQKLMDVYKQCEEFRDHNAQLILSKQQVDKQLEDRERQINELQLFANQHLSSPLQVRNSGLTCIVTCLVLYL